jgi:serine/threonine protein kinase
LFLQKPDNVGFNTEGEVKIFDFGLAKRLERLDRTDDGLYRMTGNTGSLRYMSPVRNNNMSSLVPPPSVFCRVQDLSFLLFDLFQLQEVAKCEPYDRRVDSYSFGILFWQICSLTTPYAGFSTKMHAEKVLRQGQRPPPDHTWPLTWVKLMTACWSTDIFARPEFDHIFNTLNAEVDQLIHEEGVVPTRASDIRAKNRKQKAKRGESRLDLDTRIASSVDVSVKRFDEHIV